MSAIDREALVREAMLAPSVHNVQPARWRYEGEDALLLLDDRRCRLAAADPEGRDAQISLGAAAESLHLAANRHGLRVVETRSDLPPQAGPLVPIARYTVRDGETSPDPLLPVVEARASWRGAFAAMAETDRQAALVLSGEDAAILTEPSSLGRWARRFDAASYGFMRERSFRAELVSWMRLSKGHPRWSSDGLNADAMAMSGVEALGAGFVLGRAFGLLDRIGLAPRLLAEGAKVASAAALVAFHRPSDETPFESGRAFYRLWLRIEAAGFGAAVLAALADDPAAASELVTELRLPADRRIVSAFRIGRRPPGARPARARRPLNEILA